jgi:hypothetical protein
MSAPRFTARVLSLGVLGVAAAVALWYLLHPAAPVVAPQAGAGAESVPNTSAVAVRPPGVAAAPSAAAPEAPPPQPPAAEVAAADEHQSGKIARGFSEHGGSGLLVNAVPPGSMTEQLRLQPGDIVVTVNGEAVSSVDDFVRIYRAQGMPTELTILRKGREMHLH